MGKKGLRIGSKSSRSDSSGDHVPLLIDMQAPPASPLSVQSSSSPSSPASFSGLAPHNQSSDQVFTPPPRSPQKPSPTAKQGPQVFNNFPTSPSRPKSPANHNKIVHLPVPSQSPPKSQTPVTTSMANQQTLPGGGQVKKVKNTNVVAAASSTATDTNNAFTVAVADSQNSVAAVSSNSSKQSNNNTSTAFTSDTATSAVNNSVTASPTVTNNNTSVSPVSPLPPSPITAITSPIGGARSKVRRTSSGLGGGDLPVIGTPVTKFDIRRNSKPKQGGSSRAASVSEIPAPDLNSSTTSFLGPESLTCSPATQVLGTSDSCEDASTAPCTAITQHPSNLSVSFLTFFFIFLLSLLMLWLNFVGFCAFIFCLFLNCIMIMMCVFFFHFLILKIECLVDLIYCLEWLLT